MKLLRVPRYKYYFAFSDLVILSVSFFVTAYLTESGGDIVPVEFNSVLLVPVFLSMIISFSLISGSMNMYQLNIILTRKEHIAAITKVILYVTLVTAAAAVASFSFSSISPGIIFTFALVTFSLFYLFRIEIFRALYMKIGAKRSILLLGEAEVYNKLNNILMKEKIPGTGIKQFIPVDEFSMASEELNRIIKESSIDEIIIASNNSNYDELISLIELCREQNLPVKVISEKLHIIPELLPVEKFHDLPAIDFTRKYNNKSLMQIKRIIDVVISVAALAALSPLFIAISILIKLSSSGPVLFKQRRIGLNGRIFTFYKFRSMDMVNGEDEKRKVMMLDYMKNNKAEKIINDSRVTSIGKIIRKTSIDELPQLINVLKGEMSLVGPRPSLIYEYENYEPWQKKRVKVMPGCTGVWQVSGRSSVSFTDSVLLDLYYANNMSPVLDMKLIIKTLPVMALSKGGK